jgi:hypothetical protein
VIFGVPAKKTIDNIKMTPPKKKINPEETFKSLCHTILLLAEQQPSKMLSLGSSAEGD